MVIEILSGLNYHYISSIVCPLSGFNIFYIPKIRQTHNKVIRNIAGYSQPSQKLLSQRLITDR